MTTRKRDFFQLFLNPSDSVCKYCLDFLLDFKVTWKLTIYFSTLIKTNFIKSPKLFGKIRSMTVS